MPLKPTATLNLLLKKRITKETQLSNFNQKAHKKSNLVFINYNLTLRREIKLLRTLIPLPSHKSPIGEVLQMP